MKKDYKLLHRLETKIIQEFESQFAEIRDYLDSLNIPTNGEEGYGKRQSLSLIQRIKLLGKK